jgi:hypothetical protein
MVFLDRVKQAPYVLTDGAIAEAPAVLTPAVPVAAGRGDNRPRAGGRRRETSRPGVLAPDSAASPGVAGSLARALAGLAGVVGAPAAAATPSGARHPGCRAAALPFPPRVTHYG